MKKTILIIAIISFIITAAVSQDVKDDKRDNIQVGFKIGGNLSNVYDVQGENFKANPRLGMVGGAFIRIPFGKLLGVQPEILFSQKGYNGSGSILGFDYKYSRRTHFVDVPLLVSFKPVQILTIVAGPQYSFLISQTDDFSSSILNSQIEEEFENENLRKNILGIAGGIDINMNHFVLGARTCMDITKNNGDGSSEVPRYKNMWYQLTIGFVF